MERAVTAQKKKKAHRNNQIYRLYFTADDHMYLRFWSCHVV